MKRLLFPVLFCAALLAGISLVARSQTVSMSGTPQWHSLQFTGGPIATLPASTGNNNLANGTYTAVSLGAGSVSGATGATANITVTGCPGACSAAATIVSGGATIGTTGATGYVLADVLTVAGSLMGGSGSNTFTISTLSSFSWTPYVSLIWVDAASGGMSGGGGQSGSTAAGGGGGGGCLYTLNYPLSVTPGTALAILVSPGTTGGLVANNGTATGSTTSIIGGIANIALTLTNNAAARGNAGVGGVGGNSGATQWGSSGGSGGAVTPTAGSSGVTAAAPFGMIGYGAGGGGGGGEGSGAASNGGIGGGAFVINGTALAGTAAGGTATGTLGGGGGGGNCPFGIGGLGGTLGGAGSAPAAGYGGGGGGGAGAAAGGNGAPGIVIIRVFY